MKLFRLFVIFILSVSTVAVAQKTGDIISGVVSDSVGPMMAVSVTERDSDDRIVELTVTDINGEFFLRTRNPKDRIQVSFAGYETIDLPVDKDFYELKMVKMVERHDTSEAVVRQPERVPDTSAITIPFDEGTLGDGDDETGQQPVRSDIPVTMLDGGGVKFHLEDLPLPQESLPYCPARQCWEMTLSESGIDASDYGIVTQSSKADKLFYSDRNAVFEGFMTAYDKHYSLALSPDMIWLLISQGIATHINEHAEKLRGTLVGFEGKKTLKVDTERNLFENLEDLDWIIQAFSDSIKASTGVNLAKLMTCSFSTTGLAERISSQITLMESVKKFFEYKIHFLKCGIPDVTLLGTPDDWKEIRSRLSQLDGLGMRWWRKELEPILDEFVNAAQGHVNESFWLDMVGRITEASGSRGGCASSSIPATYDGWFTAFFPFSTDWNNKIIRTPQVVSHDTKVCNGMKKVDVLYCIDDVFGNTLLQYDLELWAGFIGMEFDSHTNTLKPSISWMLRNKGGSETAFEMLDE